MADVDNGKPRRAKPATVRSYRDLLAWQEAMRFVSKLYRATRTWPREELYGITSQVRRAAVSIPTNIAEGQGRGSDKEFMRFLAIANGSLYEVETHLLIALDLGYISSSVHEGLSAQTAEIGRMIRGLMRRISEPQPQGGSSSTGR